MASRKTPRGRSGRSGAEGAEWIGGLVSMPFYVTGEGEPYRPEALFWVVPDGPILGISDLTRPGASLPTACESLRAAIERPAHGPPHAPARVRVADAGLADALRAGHPGIEIVCAPTPELDAVVAEMRRTIGEEKEGSLSYFSPGIGPEAMASFFRAAARLFRARPWKVVPDDTSLLAVTIEQLDVRDAALSVIGQAGQSLGLILFDSIDDFEEYLDAAEDVEFGEEPELPPHFVLNYERGADVAPELRKEISEHHFEVAAPDAYPWPVAIDGDLVARPPTARELAMAEAIALALAELVAEKKTLRRAWEGGEPVARTLVVTTHAGKMEVTLRAPFAREPVDIDPSYDVLADLLELAADGEEEEIDEDERAPLEEELLRRFAASPEAEGLPEPWACRFVMDFAADFFGETIATLGPPGLREIVFGIVPRKVSVEASKAKDIVAELRAFYRYLKRECGLKQADACLRVLGGGAAAKLEAALSDSDNFGMAKSLFMAGRDAGFDMDSQEGIEAWMRSIQGKPLPPSVRLPSFDAPPSASRKTAKAKKDRRKAERKARKRNR